MRSAPDGLPRLGLGRLRSGPRLPILTTAGAIQPTVMDTVPTRTTATVIQVMDKGTGGTEPTRTAPTGMAMHPITATAMALATIRITAPPMRRLTGTAGVTECSGR